MPDEEWIALVTEYVDHHCHETLTLANLAHLTHGTQYHLQRTFKKVKGITPVEYIQQTRIDNAKALLTASNQSIAEIGERVGLFNTSYFITLFKKKIDMTRFRSYSF